MTVLSVAYPLMQVGPSAGGGAEQVLSLLEPGILAAGHHSIVIAAAGSEISGELLESPAFSGEITEEIRTGAQRIHRALIERALTRYTIDLIHFHGLDFHAYLPPASVPMLATLHLPVPWYPPDIFDLPGVELNCVSQAQAASAPPGTTPAVVCNGIDTHQYSGVWRERELLLWLGRICPEKGVHIALDIAHRLDVPMIVGGPVHPFRAHQAYYADCVQPLLDDKRRYAGPVDVAQKADLLARARCLLIPSLAAETSSLVAMEAAASGTPVAAFRTGALPEVIEHGVTGFIADSAEEMAESVKKAGEISPDMCRERAHSRFSAERMRREYLALYDRVISTLHFGTGFAPHANL